MHVCVAVAFSTEPTRVYVMRKRTTGKNATMEKLRRDDLLSATIAALIRKTDGMRIYVGRVNRV